jgi:hypothetical protein
MRENKKSESMQAKQHADVIHKECVEFKTTEWFWMYSALGKYSDPFTFYNFLILYSHGLNNVSQSTHTLRHNEKQKQV